MRQLVIFMSAAAVATLVAWLATRSESEGRRNWIRRIFLFVLNLNPLSTGIWRSDFSNRETFLAAWFLTFLILLFIGFAYLPGARMN